jgi:hypothetical protein
MKIIRHPVCFQNRLHHASSSFNLPEQKHGSFLGKKYFPERQQGRYQRVMVGIKADRESLPTPFTWKPLTQFLLAFNPYTLTESPAIFQPRQDQRPAEPPKRPYRKSG